MVFMPHWEVFVLLKKLWASSQKIKMAKGGEGARLKWHIAANNKEHAQVVMTYLDFYADHQYSMALAVGKEKQLIAKCEQLGINFDKIVSLLLGTLMTAVVPLDLAIFIVTAYLFEGQKCLIRFTYALLKLGKDELLKHTTKDGLITKLRQFCQTLSQEQVAQVAFGLNLKTTGLGSNLNFSDNSEEALQSKLATQN